MKINEFRLERFFAAHEFKTPYLLCSSDCETVTVSELLKLEPQAQEELAGLSLGYTETRGAPELRKEIAGLYQAVGVNDILTFSGAEEAIFVMMNLLSEHGFSMIVPVPCYQSLTEVVVAAGGRVTPWYMTYSESEGWRLDPDGLEKLICPTTRGIVLNFPHNPTGFTPSLAEFQAIVSVAQKHNLYIFSDEVYRLLEYPGSAPLPAVCDIYDRGVSLGVMSKSFGLAGLRIGWLASLDAGLLSRAAAFKDYTTICNSAPSEFLAALALRRRDSLLKRNRDLTVDNLEHLDRFFQRHSALFSWFRPVAGPVAFPALRDNLPAEPFCRELAEKQGVLLLPGNLYNWGKRNFDGFFRIGFGRLNFRQGLERLGAFLENR